MEVHWIDVFLEKLPESTFLIIFPWRLINALTINTFFQADEYWQSLEPAHRAVFGYGYLTWEWQIGLRSYFHPLLYMGPYWIVKKLDLGYNWVLVTPKILNALIAAIGEYYLYYYIDAKFKNKRLAKLVAYLSMLSAWNWYCWCRSFANSLELSTTIIALYYLQTRNVLSCLIIAAFTCLIRPTNAIIWLFYLPLKFIQHPKYIFISVMVGFSFLLADGLLNYTIYSELKFPLLTFFKFNISDNLSSFYGISRLDFYFVQAVPILLLNYLPFFLYGVATTPWGDLKGLLVVYLSVFTLIPHKEFRFIYPLMPILLTYTANGVLNISSKLSTRLMKLTIIITVLLSSIIAFYFTQYHEAGELKITTSIHKRVVDDITNPSVGFLTPCHSTPFQSHLHVPDINIWFLTCEPPLEGNIALDSYMDESDYFYENPVQFLKDNFPKSIDPTIKEDTSSQWLHGWPNYIVMFETLWNDEDVRNYLQQHYEIVESLWNTPAHWDSRREGNVLLLKFS